MAIEYLGLSSINGPLVVLEGLQGASYDEIVEMTVNNTQKKMGRIIQIDKDKAVIQVFEGTEGMALKNTHTQNKAACIVLLNPHLTLFLCQHILRCL